MLAAFALVVGCGSDPPTDYSEVTSDNFLTACTAPGEDSLLRTRLCQCVFDRALTQIPYDRFVAIDKRLTEFPESPLPGDLAQLIADCVVEEADL